MGRKSCVAIADVSKLKEVEEMIQTSVKELGDLNTMYVRMAACFRTNESYLMH